jgi:hypothetical protein
MGTLLELDVYQRQLSTYRHNHVPWKGCVAFCRGVKRILSSSTSTLSTMSKDNKDDKDRRNELLECLEKFRDLDENLPFVMVAWEWLLDLYSLLLGSDMDSKYLHPMILEIRQMDTARLFPKKCNNNFMAMNRYLRLSMVLSHSENETNNNEKNFQSWMLTITDPVRWYRSAMMKRISWEKELSAFPAFNYRLAWSNPDLKLELDRKYTPQVSYGARGASESHTQMWKTHASYKIETLVKYSEDDMTPSPIYHQTLRSLREILSITSSELDLVWIGYHMPADARLQAMSNVSTRFLKEGPPPFGIGGMFGYIIPTRASAKKLCNLWVMAQKSPISVGIDTWIMMLSQQQLKQAHLNLPVLFSQYWTPNQSHTQRSDCGPSWNFYPVEERR